jgi:hypothetical protein
VIPPALAGLPFKAAARIRFGPAMPAQRFDFFFSDYSIDPAPTAGAPTETKNAATPAPIAPPRVRRGAAAATTSHAVPAPRIPGAVPGGRPAAPPPAHAASSSAPAGPPPTVPALVLDSPLNIPPALADALDESALPSDVPGLLAELTSRANQVEALINEGNLSQVWLPATSTKTVALVVNAKAASLTPGARSQVESAVRRIVVAAWALDNYGDLGSREKISEAYADLAGALTDLKAAYRTP